jgi:hypothetical protein
VKVPCEHQLLGILTDVDKAAGACKPRAKIQLMFLRALSRDAWLVELMRYVDAICGPWHCPEHGK